MTVAAADPALNNYISALRSLWKDGSATDPATALLVRDRMRQWLSETETDAEWVQTLKREQLAKRCLHSDPDHGFMQMSHFHEGHRGNTPHDHGPYWVVYGVMEGRVDIPVYEVNADGETVREVRVDRLSAGDAVAYLPGELHSTLVPTDEPAIVVRFLSQDLSKVPRQRFRNEQIVA